MRRLTVRRPGSRPVPPAGALAALAAASTAVLVHPLPFPTAGVVLPDTALGLGLVAGATSVGALARRLARQVALGPDRTETGR